ncbi:MAG: Rieske 2Fe-2S domain-containing protein [Alphaproteobacteria bacterium]|nr:Rieske 2Fe-2S domain-containing protein [Alphaproteobacteria bacterium]
MPDSPFTPAPGLVDVAQGLVSREAFLSDQIFRLEMERIFDRTWVFLAHESELRAPGDYVTRRLGSAPVIVIRNSDGKLHGLLNSCRHRGPKLCRTDSGNAARFVCPYHGWAYEQDGKLITTALDQYFPRGTDFSQLGLIRVPRLETYEGLIFGCWNPDVQALADYLGDFRWYLDPIFARTPERMEVLAPPHRWRVKGNWKLGALNFIGDGAHVPFTHAGPTTLDPLRPTNPGLYAPGKDSLQVFTSEGHGCTLNYINEGLPPELYQSRTPDLDALYDKTLKPQQRKMLDRLRVAVGNVFPNFSYIEEAIGLSHRVIIIRQWQPISGTEMEIWSWTLAEREASAEYKAKALASGPRIFGIAGVFEQDDVTIWDSLIDASDNNIARRYPFRFQMALPSLAKPLTDYPGPGRAYRPAITETVQFEFMIHWDKVLHAPA